MSEPEEQAEDHRLVEAARAGDERAFEQLVERYKESVFATAVAITSEFHAAHDIAQETFLRAWFGLARLEDASSFGPWLRAIARNRSRTWLERKQRQPWHESLEAEQLIDSGNSPMEEVERTERKRLAMRVLERLVPSSREVLVLRYMQGLTTPRMALQLGITDSAVRQRLRRARLQMKEEVESMVDDVIRDETPGAEFTEGVKVLLDRARALFREVKYGSAIPVLESARDKALDDTTVSMLLAEAYSFTRTPAELKENPDAYERALSLFDEVVEREPENLLARLRRAALRSTMATDDEVFSEQQALLEEARGGRFESVAELEVARRFLTRGQGDKALGLYKGLESKYPWMTCVLLSEMGVCHAMVGDGKRAMRAFENAVKATTPQAMAALQAISQELLGEAYWAFWSSVDNLSVRQCQNHAWLAGLSQAGGQMKKARRHLEKALEFLAAEEVGEARAVLRCEFVNRMEQMFPQLAAEPEVQALKSELESGE